MARIGVEVALIQDYEADLISPQTEAEIYNQELGDTLPVLLVTYEQTKDIDFTTN